VFDQQFPHKSTVFKLLFLLRVFILTEPCGNPVVHISRLTFTSNQRLYI
jgi:predicted small integral membrane protein